MKSLSLTQLLLALSIIVILGITTILSIYPDLLSNQLTFFLAGLFLLIVFSRVDPKLLQQLAPYLYSLSVFLLILTFVLGNTTRGSIRWVDVGPFRLQFSELVKPLLILFFASRLNKRIVKPINWLIEQLIWLGIPVALIFLQPDLGSSIVISSIWLGMLLSSQLPRKYSLSFIALALVLLPLGYPFLKEYQKQRIHTFVNPFSDPTGSGYNVIQAMIAVGSGGLLGKGVRQGTQSHLRFLPERHTDFAFASFAEEFGFIGTSILITCFFVFLLWLLRLADRLDTFGRLVVVGAFWLFFTQITINVGMNMGILPVTGITLPFISYGGSSILSSAITLGVVIAFRNSQKRTD